MAAADPADAQVRSRGKAARGRFGAVWQGVQGNISRLLKELRLYGVCHGGRRRVAGLQTNRTVTAPVSANSVGEFAG